MRLVPPCFRVLCAAFVAFAILPPAFALAGDLITIERAKTELERGMYFSVNAVVTESKGDNLYGVEDETGDMVIYVSESLQRDMDDLKVGDQLTLFGEWDLNPLEPENQGMRVWKLRKRGNDLGGRGTAPPAAATTPIPVTPIPEAATGVAQDAPAAPREGGEPDVMRSRASEALKRQVQGHMKAYREAEAQALAAGEDYARAAREAGANGQVDPAVVEKLDAAEARVVELRSGFPKLIDEARAAGVDESIITMIELETGLR